VLLKLLLIQRSKIYYIRWQLPSDIRLITGKREFIRSLRCKDKFTATLRSQPYMLAIERIKRARYLREMELLTEDNYRQVVQQLWSKASVSSRAG
jgi:hypothetical protein